MKIKKKNKNVFIQSKTLCHDEERHIFFDNEISWYNDEYDKDDCLELNDNDWEEVNEEIDLRIRLMDAERQQVSFFHRGFKEGQNRTLKSSCDLGFISNNDFEKIKEDVVDKINLDCDEEEKNIEP